MHPTSALNVPHASATYPLAYKPYSPFFHHPAPRIPNFFRPPKNTTTVKGGNFTLTCRAYLASAYQWLFNSAPLEPLDRINTAAIGDLTVTNVGVADKGEYTCVAFGPDGTANASATVSVFGDLLTCSGEMMRECMI